VGLFGIQRAVVDKDRKEAPNPLMGVSDHYVARRPYAP
jgi:hypothetical protein